MNNIFASILMLVLLITIILISVLLIKIFKNNNTLILENTEKKSTEAFEVQDNMFYNNNVMVKKSNVAGRGVFAMKDFDVDEIVEIAPSLIDSSENFIGKLVDYVSSVPEDESKFAIHMGYFNYYNHNDDSNASFKVDGPNERVIVTCVKPIKKDEEIFINYGNNYWDVRKDRLSKI